MSGFKSSGLPNVTPREAFDLCDEGACIIDLRKPYATTIKHFGVPGFIIPGPEKQGDDIYNDLDRSRTYIVSDTANSTVSRVVVKEMLEKGFKSVFNMAGGFVEWEREGLPVLHVGSGQLSGSCLCQLKPRNLKEDK